MLVGNCVKNCDEPGTKIQYQFEVFKQWKIQGKSAKIWVLLSELEMHAKGLNTDELSLLSSFFLIDPDTVDYKIRLKIISTKPGKNGATTFGYSSIIIRLNKLPYNGDCTISPDVGYSPSTIFTFNCSNWFDIDGEIASYSYFGNIIRFK
jgi:hypothetical protein